MKRLTLDAFIQAYPGVRPANQYVVEKGFRQLYVRMTPRRINGVMCDPTLDIANVIASWPGRGAFTDLIKRLRQDYPGLTLFVECASGPRFQRKLQELGFVPADPEVAEGNYVLPVENKLLTISSR